MKLHYADQGRGPAVLLVHAFPLDRTIWELQIERLSKSFRTITPDIRGFGYSRPAQAWTIKDACDDLAGLLDELRIDRCAFVGLSMGGYIGLPFYARHSERISKLVLADTRARADNDAEKAGRTEMIAALQQDGIRILPDRMLPRLLKPNPSIETVKTVRAIIERTDPVAAIFALMAMRDRADSSTILNRITCPALVMVGEQDTVTRVDESREMAQSISGSRFVQIPSAGHLSNLENPEAFNEALEGFMS